MLKKNLTLATFLSFIMLFRTGHVEIMGERRDAYRVLWWGDLTERDSLEDGRIILK
jgi:hypothetical protein